MAGVITQVRDGYELVADLLTIEDFYEDRHQRIWAAAAGLTDVPALVGDTSVGEFNVRVGIVAEAANVSPSYVQSLVDATPVMANSRPWALRVVAATRRRRAMLALADAYNALGDGAELKDVAEGLRPVLEEAS